MAPLERRAMGLNGHPLSRETGTLSQSTIT